MPSAELVVENDPPDARARNLFEHSSVLRLTLLHWPSFLCFGGRPAPDSFAHFRNVFVSYFFARAFPPLLPILRRNSRTSSPGVSFLGTPKLYNLAARLSAAGRQSAHQHLQDVQPAKGLSV